MQNKKYTFWELCNSYDKIEIPKIQRDYAQGRNTYEVQKLRDKFVNNYLIEALLTDNHIELDFVYGSILTEKYEDEKQKCFIPLDGQQRLTTLFLMHYFVAVKEKRLPEVKDVLERFTYETRPSAKDFCRGLLKFNEINDLTKIREEIKDSAWFNAEWINDPTVEGMLNMLFTFGNNKSLLESEEGLLEKLLQSNENLITFYFTDLDQFGLTENLYIRMNARGKKLTDFENFKSEFFKIIRYNVNLLEEFKDKIEYKWVENLWGYRSPNSFVIDEPFMVYLNFITEMLYYKNAEFKVKPYEGDFLDFNVLKDIYSVEENLRSLIFALDYIARIKTYDTKIIWNESSQKDTLFKLLTGKIDITETYILFMSIRYSYLGNSEDNLNDFLRVVRNLISNTKDNSRREWPRLISSLENLISDDNVYSSMSRSNEEIELIGFDVDQRKEEHFKAQLIENHPEFKNLIFEIEDDKNFKGNIANILKTPFANNEEDFAKLDINDVSYSAENFEQLRKVFEGFKIVSKDNFRGIWGDLLITDVYVQTYDSRLLYQPLYHKHPSILLHAKDLIYSGLDIDSYTELIQKKYIALLSEEYDDFSCVKEVQYQLYLYFIIDKVLGSGNYETFFKNGYCNFGWLKKEKGYKSYFTEGLEGCQYFQNSNPIFQVYNQQFRYNLGINQNNTLDIEIIGSRKLRDPFERIKKWALEN